MKRIVLATLFVFTALGAAAHDFSAAAPSGQTLYYNIVTGGVEVTFPANTNQPINGWNGYTKPTGALTVPATATNNGLTYNVVAVHGFAFYECTGLTSVSLPEGVLSIGNSAFNGCTTLGQFAMPASLTSIGGAAFYNCVALANVTCNATVPPTAVGSTFQGVSTAACELHVPCQYADSYLATTPWNTFNIVGEGCSVTITVGVNHPGRGTVAGGGTYSVDTTVTLTAQPAPGYFFACWSDGDTVNPRMVNATADMSLTAWFFFLQHDTVEVHDTLTLFDTVSMVVVHTDTVPVHDTTIVNYIIWDTLYVHDTTTVNLVVWDTVYVHDTVTISLEGTDTIYIHDTTAIHDTVLPTFFRLQVTANAGGVGIGNGVLPAGTVAEIGALPLEGYRFVAWNDGSTLNPRTINLTSNVTYTAEFEPVTGIGQAVSTWSLMVDGRTLAVECDPGSTVGIFSADGRQLMHHTAADGRLRVWMPAAGVYLVQVNQSPARKVVVK